MLHHAIREACLRKTLTPIPQSGASIRDLWIQEKRLKPREVEALNFVREGLLDKEIAGKMGCSEADTKWILRCVYAKLGVHHRAEAINIWNATPQ
jgi:DNA-binding NarL/FixJ family response regulator